MFSISNIRSKLIVYLRKFLRLVYARRLVRYPELQSLVDKFSKSKSAAVDLADAIALYEYIHRLKPKCILELGPGTSTNIISLAIDEIKKKDPSYEPTFLSIEENPEWLRYHEATFEPSLRKHVKLDALPTAKKQVDATGGAACYVGLPKLKYDFVFVDGPDFLRHGCEWSCDVIDLLDNLAPRVWVVFDGREVTARETWKRLQSKGFKRKRNPYSLCYEIYRE